MSIWFDSWASCLSTHIDYVMEVAEGGSLKALLNDKTRADALRSSDRVARLLHGVLSALEHLHSHHFFHRDLGACNILLSSAEQATQVAKLADWGLFAFHFELLFAVQVR